MIPRTVFSITDTITRTFPQAEISVEEGGSSDPDIASVVQDTIGVAHRKVAVEYDGQTIELYLRLQTAPRLGPGRVTTTTQASVYQHEVWKSQLLHDLAYEAEQEDHTRRVGRILDRRAWERVRREAIQGQETFGRPSSYEHTVEELFPMPEFQPPTHHDVAGYDAPLVKDGDDIGHSAMVLQYLLLNTTADLTFQNNYVVTGRSSYFSPDMVGILIEGDWKLPSTFTNKARVSHISRTRGVRTSHEYTSYPLDYTDWSSTSFPKPVRTHWPNKSFFFTASSEGRQFRDDLLRVFFAGVELVAPQKLPIHVLSAQAATISPLLYS